VKEYILFLDESRPIRGNHNFCLAGIIISKDDYENILVPKINEYKQNRFGRTDFYFHLYDIKKKNPPFDILDTKNKMKSFFKSIRDILTPIDFSVLSTCINRKEYENIYLKNRNDEYFVTLQIILENYVHFLIAKGEKSVGTVCIESVNKIQDDTLRKHYFRLLLNGTLFIKRKYLEERLLEIDFHSKPDNIIGLQIADLIPNTLPNVMDEKLDYYGLGKLFQSKLYDGNCNALEKFGFKKLF